MKKILTLAIFIILLSACTSNDNPVNEPEHNGVLLTDQAIQAAQESRQYHLYLPANPQSAPVVFLFHGNGGSSDQILGLDNTVAPYKVWIDIAERENLILVIPDGNKGSTGTQGWNDCRFDNRTNPTSDDVAFFEVLLADIQTRYASFESPVYVVGTSNGGSMVQRLADEVPEKLNAAAVLVTSRPVNTDCTEASLPLPILFMNGTEDPLVPYTGGQIASNRGEVLSTHETIRYWVRRNQTNPTPTETALADTDSRDTSTITRFSYSNLAGQRLVEHYEILNGGHTEPSIVERYGNIYKLIVGNQNHDLEMAEELWTFFQLHGSGQPGLQHFP